MAIGAGAADKLHIGAGERCEPVARRRGRRLGAFQGGQQIAKMRFQNGEEHILLAIDIIRHPVRGDAEALRQAQDRGALVAEFGEEPGCRDADGGAFGCETGGAM